MSAIFDTESQERTVAGTLCQWRTGGARERGFANIVRAISKKKCRRYLRVVYYPLLCTL